MTTLEDVEALAQRLSPAERVSLAKRWLEENSVEPLLDGEHPGVNGGAEPDALADLDARIALVGAVVSGRRDAGVPSEDDSIWGLGSAPVDCGVSDGSTNHDRYFYDSPDH